MVAAGPALAEQDNYIDAQRGKALATVGDCIACHTAPGGKPFAGGFALQTPFGAIMTPNLTPDDATGIGRWSKDNFARAMHEGRRPDGAYLYPAFPYPYYTKVTRAGRRCDLRLSADAGAGVEQRQPQDAAVSVQHPDLDVGMERAVFHAGLFRRRIPSVPRNSTAAPIWSKVSAIAARATRR